MKKLLNALLILVIFTLNAPALNAQAESANPLTKGQSYSIIPVVRNAIKPNQTILELKPGSVHNEKYLIENLSDEKIELINYAADAMTTDKNSFTIKDKKDPQETIGQWIHFEEPTINLEPEEKKEVTAVITIPEETALGTYIGGITTEKMNEKVGNVRISTRIALKVQINVTDEPQEIPLLKSGQANIFEPTPFFWGTFALFLFSISYYFYANKKEKQKKQK